MTNPQQPYTAATRPMFRSENTPRTANQRIEDAKNLPPIAQLVGEIWQTGELAFLFADTGVGKSILLVQFADNVTNGRNSLRVLKNDTGECAGLFYDFELSDRQFYQRYIDDFGIPHKFNDNLRIDNVDFQILLQDNPSLSVTEILQEKIRHDVDIMLTAYPGRHLVLFIDNISYLTTISTADAAVAMNIMRFLDGLKREFKISICVVAHTPKIDLNSPISINSLAGSKALSNFADSVFAIGASNQGKNIRYLKQVKPSRSAEMVYDRNNVLTIELVKSGAFLGFDIVQTEPEYMHLNISAENANNDRKLMVIELHKAGRSLRDIEKETGISKTTVARIIKEFAENEK